MLRILSKDPICIRPEENGTDLFYSYVSKEKQINSPSFLEEVIYIEGIKEAAPVGWNGSYADEGKSQSWWLPITVVRSHINLSAFDHSEMASDINRLASCFLALCAKALIKAYRRVLHPHFSKQKEHLLISQTPLVD